MSSHLKKKQSHLKTQQEYNQLYNTNSNNCKTLFGIQFGKPVRLSNIKRKHLSSSREQLESLQKKNSTSLNKENLMTSNGAFQRVITQESNIREELRTGFLPKLNQKNSKVKQQPQKRLERVRSQRNMEESTFQMIGSYRVGGVLGKGSYATVRLARNWKGSTFAIKVYDRSSLNDSFKLKNVNNQIQVLSSLSHPSILKFVQSISSNDNISIVTELIDNTCLIEWLKFQPKKIAPKDDMRRIMKSILEALHYIHDKNIAHRDLKMENILISKGLKIKIIDFGFAIKDDHIHNQFCGTPHYISPEIISKGGYLGKPSDIWAAGIIFYKLYTGDFPFKAINNKALYRKICRGDLLFNTSQRSTEIEQIITTMLRMDSSFRPSAGQLLKNQWFYKQY